MGFPFTLKGFPRKSGFLHFYMYFLVWVLFTYIDTIHIHDTIHVYGYYSFDVNKCYPKVVLEQ